MNATNSWHMETLLHDFFVPFNVFLMLPYYTLFLEQNIIVSFDGPVQQYNNNYWKAFFYSLFIQKLVVNACISSILMWHSLQLVENFFIHEYYTGSQLYYGTENWLRMG